MDILDFEYNILEIRENTRLQASSGDLEGLKVTSRAALSLLKQAYKEGLIDLKLYDYEIDILSRSIFDTFALG